MSRDRIVAVGLLTAKDLEVLGSGFRRMYAVEEGGQFDDLIRRLDRFDAVPATPDRTSRKP